MIKSFQAFGIEHHLFGEGASYLLAVSGGVDSVVMADIFHKSGHKFAIAHCNFSLRGIDADNDEVFVKNLAKGYNVKFYSKRFETEKFARKRKVSIQMAARELRYDWFRKLQVEEKYDKLATAHHANDSLETILFNLAKGTGIAGFHGIRPSVDNKIRPLLFASKEMIVNYATEHQLKWREDKSNASKKYHRNLIRHKVVPVLKTINPELENKINQTTQRILAVEKVFASYLEDFKEKYLQTEGSDVLIDKKAFAQTEVSPTLLHEVIKTYGFNYTQAGLILVDLDSVGRSFDSQGFRLNIDRDHLILSPQEAFVNKKEVMITLEDKTTPYAGFVFKFVSQSSDSYLIQTDQDIAGLDFDKLEFPLVLRGWKEGDSFQPLGMQRKKKLSDFMIDEKIPLNLKSRVNVLISGGNIAWVVGHRIDSRFKITSKTKKVYQLRRIRK